MKIPGRSNHRRFLLLQAAASALLAASSVHAATYTWDGGSTTSAGWNQAANWVGDPVPTFDNQADIIFNALSAARLSNFLGTSGTIRSLTFNADSDSNVTIRLTTGSTNTTAANLTFDTDAVGGNATITVDAGSAGNHNVGVSTGNIALSDNLVITHDGSGTLTLSRPVTGAFNVTKGGTGTLIFSAVNTYTGTTTINAGTLNLTGNRTAGAGPITVQTGGTLGISNGNFSLGLASTQVFQVGLGSGTSTVNHTSGTISTGGGGNQIYMGLGGIYNLSGGELNIGYTGGITGGRGLLIGTSANSTTTFNLSGTGYLNMAGSTSGLNLGLNANGVTSLFNQTGGTATIQYLRIGGVTATGINSTLRITGGVFTAATFDRLATGGTNTALIHIGGTADVTLPAFPTAALGVGSTATITFDGGVLKNLAASTNYLGSISSAQIKNGGAKFNTTAGDITITQALENFSGHTGSLTKEGANTLTLSNANTYTGTTTINAGTLALSAAGSIASSSGVNLSATGAGLDISGASGNRTIGSFAGAAGSAVVLGGNTLTAGDATNTTFAGVISGSGGLTKASAGTLSLTAIQDFTGPLSVSAGSLAVSGTNLLANASRIDVLAGATLDATAAGIQILGGQTLGGYGTVSGNLAFASGAILSPGGSVGTLSGTAGTTTWNSGLIYEFEVNNATGTPGIDPGWDLFSTTGGLTLAAGPEEANQIVIDLISLSGTGSGQAANFDASANYQWRFAVAGSAITTFNPDWFRVQTANFQNPASGSFSVALGGATSFEGEDDRALYVVYAAVPEPGTLALAGIGLAGAAWAATRRRRRGAV